MATPKGLSDLELHRAPTSRWDEYRLRFARRKARNLFNRARRISDRSLEQEFPGISDCRAVIQPVLDKHAILGNVQTFELVVLATLCTYLKPELIFEFGTFIGLTTLNLALNSPASTKLITIDWEPGDPRRWAINDDTYYTRGTRVGEVFRGRPEAAKIEQLKMDSRELDAAPLRARVDLAFVDGGHEYEVVRADSEKAMEMLAPGGAIVWHDYVYSHRGVYTWLNELSASLPLFTIANTAFVCYHKAVPPQTAPACGAVAQPQDPLENSRPQ